MGLADFLVEAGRGTGAERIGRAMGGTNQRVDDFVNKQLPALANEIHANTDETKIPQLGIKFLKAASDAGIPGPGAEKMMEMIIGPTLQGIRQEGLNKLFDQYKGQPAVAAESRPEINGVPKEGPLTPQGNFIDPRAATPDKPLDLNFISKFGQLTRANPEQFNKMLETPATIAGKQASTQHTQQAIDAEKAKQDAISGLSSTPQEPGQPSLQATARINPGGIQQFLPVRQDQGKEDYQNQLLGLKQQGLENQLTLARDRMGAASDRADLATTRAQFNQEAELRKEFQGQSKDFQTVRDSYNRVKSALQAQTPAGDMSGIYNWMHQQDPRSTVRESEFRMAETAKPLLERMGLSWNTIGALWQGKKLTPGQRADFLARSQELYDSANQQHQKRVGEYSRVAKESGLNPSRVITDMEATGEAPAAPAGQGGYSGGAPSGSGSGSGQGSGAPAVGTISKGYRFKGGNPADRNSWEKVQ